TAPQAVRNVAEDLALRAASPAEVDRETTGTQAYRTNMAIYWVIDLFILFVAGMFVSNMLARSVAERRTEFGTLRAIGIPGRHILLAVVAEAMFTVLVSYVLGFAVSLLLGWAMNVW